MCPHFLLTQLTLRGEDGGSGVISPGLYVILASLFTVKVIQLSLTISN